MLGLLSLVGIPVLGGEAPRLGFSDAESRSCVAVKYFPVKGDLIDQKVTGDWGLVDETRKKTDNLTHKVLAALHRRIRVTMPTRRATPSPAPGGENLRVPGATADRRPLRRRRSLTDYNKIMLGSGIEKIERKGVKK